ncbi:tRNA (5-methylaminomethyl-2-thiouridine)(34)-methyltransferase MnmD [Halarcobacter sp.]|uniref:tRNA (5-methylaminomethyl-2-thiouridine)(34)-methyltransferase MnmD n=1 Tax=Halarcobacter sp. TaxID=2321133 RepID=UPI003A8F5A37
MGLDSNMIVKTNDNSNTLYSKKYNQHFHDIKTGAIQESLTKHVIPSFNFHKDKKHLRILDICFGLGYNTFSTINYVLENGLDKKLEIFSPELDGELIESLKEFEFPQEFEKISHIIKELLETKKYKDENIQIELFIGDAREYIKTLDNLDIVYQDAFSSEVNGELWTVEYFTELFSITNENAVVTTYSIASNVRLSLYEAGFEIYEVNPTGKMKQTIAIKNKKDMEAKYIDMQLKQERNKELKALYD